MVTFQLKPTSITGSSRQSFSTWENTRISLSWDASCSLSGSSNHEGPNFPIPITTLGIMADNSVIPFPGNGKRHTEPPGNRSYTWQQNRRKNSGPWNKAYVFLDSDPLNIGPTVKKADHENFHHFKLCWILGAEMTISEKKKKKRKSLENRNENRCRVLTHGVPAPVGHLWPWDPQHVFNLTVPQFSSTEIGGCFEN